MILGTAGHVDHGKSALVKALTGIDPDRLPEEKRRGITLELGFAHLTLADGTVLGVVDVPGHERFVKAMVAGAGGIDLALFVVAVDEGVMPQTREHLDICRLLGVRRGCIALTKSDLLPGLGADWLPRVRKELAELSAGTFLEGAAMIPVSTFSGEGLPPLKLELGRLAKSLGERPPGGPMLLPIDRAFTVKGFGSVVTGTLLSGELDLESVVTLIPGDGAGLRIRSLQLHGGARDRVSAGQRVAVNLPELALSGVSRGMALTRPGELPPSRILDVELELLPQAPRALRRRERLLLHLGTAQRPCTVALLGVEMLAPGHSALAQLRLAEPVAALVHQRFILRGTRALVGRGATLAGGRVLSLAAKKRRPAAAEALRPLREADPSPEVRVRWLLAEAGQRGFTEAALFARTGLPLETLRRTLQHLATGRHVLLLDPEARLFLDAAVVEALAARVRTLLQSAASLPREVVRHRLSPDLSPRLFARVLEALTGEGAVVLEDQRIFPAGRMRPAAPPERSADAARLLRALESAGLAPPGLDLLAAANHLPAPRVKTLLEALVQEGQAVKVAEGIYYARSKLDPLRQELVKTLEAEGEISTQGFKELVQQSRKYVIPLAEYFDRERVTLRVGDKRVLRRG